MLIRSLDTIATIETITQIKEIKTILFDLDGTLVDTECLHAEALHMTLKKIDPASNESIINLQIKFQGMSDTDVFKKLDSINISLTEFLQIKNNNFIDIINSKNEILHTEIRKLLKDIKSLSFKLGLVTASERIIAEVILKKIGIFEMFDIIICRDDLTKSKPDPLPYLTAMKELNSFAKETIIFEDSETGLAAAKSSGAHYFKVNWFKDV
ncbi:HAD family phosphatase [Halobacteriovorax sp. HLS]|uniref:HAD family hydrolase n=1 Tax=Halobacteriovorax sp. HLS TaxID=2234000 RepID=UPI000FDA7559|nr:HAD family phosphatase [Halobacteriovorax sp. HLS]